MADQTAMNADEKRLAELGYKQELNRNWSGFSNFAISFSIISILAGCFTTFGQAWNNGGPIAISIGWPLIAAFILIIGFCLSELVSAYPTSGGIYWWASKLGGPKAGYYTGWLNLIGLLAVIASVAYGCATFFDLAFSTLNESWAAGYSLQRVFIMFIVILILISALNIFSGHLMAILNNVSVWWHVFGAALIILILVFLPDNHMSFNDVFTMRVNNTGGLERRLHGRPRFLVLRPAPGLPAHAVHDHRVRRLGPPLRGDAGRSRAAQPRASGSRSSTRRSAAGCSCWRSCSRCRMPTRSRRAVAASPSSSRRLSTPSGAGMVLLISAIGQFFCSMACMTSTSRMTYAFSRDGAVPGSQVVGQASRRPRCRRRP